MYVCRWMRGYCLFSIYSIFMLLCIFRYRTIEKIRFLKNSIWKKSDFAFDKSRFWKSSIWKINELKGSAIILSLMLTAFVWPPMRTQKPFNMIPTWCRNDANMTKNMNLSMHIYQNPKIARGRYRDLARGSQIYKGAWSAPLWWRERVALVFVGQISQHDVR